MGRLMNAYRAFTGRAASLSDLSGQGYSRRPSGLQTPTITQETALRNSVWWAGLHLKANVMSSFPYDVIKPGPDGLTYAVANPGTLIEEPWPGVDITEFSYSSEMDLSRYGNFVGIIHQWNQHGKPTMVEPALMSAVSAKMNGNVITEWRIGSTTYDVAEIWHQRRHTVSGWPLGMSTLAYAAWSLGLHQSATEFALDWFATGANPKGTLKHTERSTIPSAERELAKEEFKAATAGGDIFVHGNVWEWSPAEQDAPGAGFLEMMTASNQDTARYVGVPPSMIGVETATGNITYANITQANLEWLITEMGPNVRRDERYWSRYAMPKPWQVKRNTDALLRMDPTAKADLMVKLVGAKLRAPDELRALDNLPPFTPDQIAQIGQFAALGKPTPTAPTQQAGEVVPWQTPV